MPELPEVETTLRGIQPYLRNASVQEVVVRNASLRWPVPSYALSQLKGQAIVESERRAKYILLHTPAGIILLHLGMSGSLRVCDSKTALTKHDHIDLVLDNGAIIRYNDPRRFGCCLLIQQPVNEHKLLQNLGPEPLTDGFDGDYMFAQSRGRSLALKNFIMEGKIVVGVGNIYASESLFLAGIRPTVAAQRLSRKRYNILSEKIKSVLQYAIEAGGTTLNDFTQADGKPGYFKQQLHVYGRAGQACTRCKSRVKSQVIGQRNTFYCPECQSF